MQIHTELGSGEQPERIFASDVRSSAPSLQCYALQPAADRFTLTPVHVSSFIDNEANGNAFLLFAPSGFSPSEALLKAAFSHCDARPELSCLIVSSGSQALQAGLQPSLALFSHCAEQGLWAQVAAVIIRAELAATAAPFEQMQEIIWAGFIHTQSVWVLEAQAEHTVAPQEAPLSYQQFMAHYEKLTRLTQLVPERKSYRQSYLRSNLQQLFLQEVKTQPALSPRLRDAIRYYAASLPAKTVRERLLLKSPDIYFTLLKYKKSTD